MTVLDPGELLCRRCDVYVGFGAAGVVEVPKDKDLEWLVSHCWMCPPFLRRNP